MDPEKHTLTVSDAWRKYDSIESRLTAPVSERMLDLAALRPGMRVIDLATGRGEPALRAAQRVGPLGAVLGVDVSESLLAIARERARAEDISNIELRAGDAQSLDGISDDSFDAATVRWGLGSMQSPVTALASTRRVLKRGGVLVAACWAELERCPWAFLPRRLLGRYGEQPRIDADAPGAFRHADPSRLARELVEAGFTVEHLEEVDVPVIEADSGAGIVAWVRDLGLAPSKNRLSEEEQATWATELAREVEQLRVGDVVRLGGVTRLVVARRAR